MRDALLSAGCGIFGLFADLVIRTGWSLGELIARDHDGTFWD